MPFQNTIITTNTANTIIPATSSYFNDLLWMIMTNTSATGVRVDVTVVGGTPASFWLPANSTIQVYPPGPVPAGATNTGWTATCSSAVTDVRVFVSYYSHQ